MPGIWYTVLSNLSLNTKAAIPDNPATHAILPDPQARAPFLPDKSTPSCSHLQHVLGVNHAHVLLGVGLEAAKRTHMHITRDKGDTDAVGGSNGLQDREGGGDTDTPAVSVECTAGLFASML